MRRSLIAVALFLAVVACGTQQESPAQPAAAYQAYLVSNDQQRISVADSQNGKELRSLPAGVPAPDWSLIYSLTQVGAATEVRAVDTRTGSILRRVTVPGSYRLPTPDLASLPGGLSPNGRWLALFNQTPERSTFVILDTSFKSPAQTVTLAGAFHFDALNNNGDGLFLLKTLAGGHYQVRFYDLAQKRLDPTVIVDKREPGEPMNGTRVTSLNSPSGDRHYGLYFRPNQAPFIHALPLQFGSGPLAWCVDVPGPKYLPPTIDWSLAQTSTGRLFVTSGLLGVVADVTPGDPPEVAHTLKLPGAPAGSSWPWTDAYAKEAPARTSAVLSSDQKSLYVLGRAGIVVVDTTRLQVVTTWEVKTSIVGLLPTPDGKALLALSGDNRLLRFDTATGKQGASVPIDPRAVLNLVRVEASV